MALADLKKKIYKPGADFGQRLKRPEFFDSGKDSQKPEKEEWLPLKKKKRFKIERLLTPRRKKILKWALLVLGIILLVVATLAIWQGLNSFDKHKVKLEILGPARAVGGDEVTYTVKYTNETKVALQDVKLTFYFPKDSVPSQGQDLIQTIDLADLEPAQSGESDFLVALVGVKDEIKTARAKLDYQPANFNARFDNEAEFTAQIISIPLALDFDLPPQLVSGQSFNFSLEYRNEADVSFDDLQLKIEYPDGFNFQSAAPSASQGDNLWKIGNLMAGEQKKIFIEGSLEGSEGQAKSFKAQLGTIKNGQFVLYTEIVEPTRIAVSPLYVLQTVNDLIDYVAKPGETLTYKIDYKNTTKTDIGAVVIVAKLTGQALDFATLDLGQGSFDGLSQTIVWRASNLSELDLLRPNQGGQIEFSIDVKDSLPIHNYSDKNFVIINTVKIDSLQPPLALKDIQLAGESHLETKVISQLAIQAKGFYSDDLFSNLGPIPPKVGQSTTYTIRWELSNTSNDLQDVKVTAYLPPHVQWKNKVEPNDANLKYSSNTGQLVWEVGDLSAATGVLVPAKWVAWQVAITPGLVHLGNTVELIGQSRASGQDSFVELELSNLDQSIDTNSLDDPTLGSKDGIVVK